METSPKPTTWIGSGIIAVAALAAAYNLGRTSAASDRRPQRHQDAASKDNPDLRSALSAAQKRLTNCEKALQRRDHPLQKRAGKPHINTNNPTASPAPELPKQCIVASQAKDLTANCTNIRRHFNAYKAILGSSTLGCETVLSILELAQKQYSICAIISRRTLDDTSQPDATSDPRDIDANENAHPLRSEHGDIDMNALVKNPACIARMQTE
ncbi:hypothetical protein [Sorangium cellulosum]|uniref:hypothetical protein n=1 Tax=Sorangium cellulosum TaxID=56 RepID=UPI001013AB4E|nr:hypothetical protein [Sorangium cellulosum]